MRLFGFEIGGRSEPNARFDALAGQADERGIVWRDLIADGYRVRGDLYASGILIRYDWEWRIRELERRLNE
ncbi:MAG: hypothetical protein HKN74_13680 [Acidimicrobiia bacterium]|nr:hypothetical protein [Acidimicrobiia bacterium]NNF11326.1 hypothetical protein [Acidimicrobiia bacterium]